MVWGSGESFPSILFLTRHYSKVFLWYTKYKKKVSMKTVSEILKLIEQNRETIEGFGVTKLGLFGSVVRGEAKQESDLDFLVEFDPYSFDNYMNLLFFLEDLFQCKVDLVIPENIKPRLKPYIMEEVVYAEGF